MERQQVPYRSAWLALSAGFGLVALLAAGSVLTGLSQRPENAGPLALASGLIGLAFWAYARWGRS